MKIIKYILIVVVISIAVFSGFFVGKNQGMKIGLEQGIKESEIKISEFKEKMDLEIGASEVIYPEEVFSISGTIKSIGENIVVIEIEPVMDFVADQDRQKTEKIQKETVNILIDENTKIAKVNPLTIFPPGEDLSKKSQEEADKLLIKLSDLTEGSNISATAEENIKDKKEFTASLIWIN